MWEFLITTTHLSSKFLLTLFVRTTSTYPILFKQKEYTYTKSIGVNKTKEQTWRSRNPYPYYWLSLTRPFYLILPPVLVMDIIIFTLFILLFLNDWFMSLWFNVTNSRTWISNWLISTYWNLFNELERSSVDTKPLLFL